MIRALIVLLVVLGASTALARHASAQDTDPALARAMQAYSAGELDRALVAFDEALRAPGNGRAELARIHFHLGVLRASLGESDVARREFAIALALDPSLVAPDELSPAQRASFDEARVAGGGRSLELAVELEGGTEVEGAPAPLTLHVEARGAPPDLIATHEVRARAGEGAPYVGRVEGERGALTIPVEIVARGPVVAIDVSALDLHGGRLAIASTIFERPGASALEPPPVGSSSGSRSGSGSGLGSGGGDEVIESPWLWLAIGLVVVGGAVTAGVLVATTEDRYLVGAPIGP